MSTVSLATDQADALALDTIEAHHAELAGALALRIDALQRAVGREDGIEPARRALVDWCETELVPHARAEEEVLYPPALDRSETRLLVRAMVAEHELLTDLVARLASGREPFELVADAAALRALFETHVAKENELLLPALATDARTSLAALLEDMHRSLPARSDEEADAEPVEGTDDQGGHACGCHEADVDAPELDARAVPHAIRHATVFGALDAVVPGSSMVLVAPHDPLPLLAQIAERHPGRFGVDYLERGPEAWRLLFTRGN